MENILFQTMWLGFILLTLLIVSSLYTYGGDAWYKVADKTILAIVAWAIFGLLLLGRYLWGWRGRRAVYFTLAGVGIITVLYFGSQWMVML
jgi:ABC-type uncharacterized transport system permease subunit